jgi:DNA/RNA endonuclease G (NUC1)
MPLYIQELLVFTGPVFAPLFINEQWTYVINTIGKFPKLIHVPTHFFKVIVGRRANSNQKGGDDYLIGAFLVPNISGIDKQVQ